MIDFHCHLDLYPEPTRVVQECERRDLRVLSVTTTPSAWNGTSELATGSAGVRTALGLHPQLIHERKHELALFEQLLPTTQFVGEIGLDGAPEFRRHWADQVAVFESILSLCGAAGGRFLSIHSRRATSTILEYLERAPGAGVTILHWFSGSVRELERAVALGCWFSVGPAMFSGQRGRDLISRMPQDRVLTESDGPFTRVNEEPARPWDVEIAVAGLGKTWNKSNDCISRRLSDNLERLLSPPSFRVRT